MNKKHLFVIDPELGKLYSREDTAHIINDLAEMELNKLPYPIVSIEFSFKLCSLLPYKYSQLADELSGAQSFIYNDVSYNPPAKDDKNAILKINFSSMQLRMNDGKIVSFNHKKVIFEDGESSPERIMNFCITQVGLAAELLMCCLATRGVHRVTEVDKLAKLGIGDGKRYAYVTTVSIPKFLTESHGEYGIRGPVRPHVRRGHIRRQWWGPNNSLCKKIWVEPTLVNWEDDPADFVNERDRYHISKAKGAGNAQTNT